MKRLGRYTLLFERRPAILGHAAVCGKKEAAGPLARDFDQTFLDSYLNQESWEKAESMLTGTGSAGILTPYPSHLSRSSYG